MTTHELISTLIHLRLIQNLVIVQILHMGCLMRWREAEYVLVAETCPLLLVPAAGPFPLVGEDHLLFARWPFVLEPHHPHAFGLLG